jgi:protein-S-isoprenylcysteine O-methyltransferase Ste14
MSPLLAVWPFAAVFWAVFLWAYWPEFGIVARARTMVGPQDAGSMRIITTGLTVGTLAAFVLAYRLPAAALPARFAFFWLGVASVVAASLVRRHCFRMLGASFTGAVVVTSRQAVVERGAYRWVRHPSYTAGGLMFIGIGLALGNWASLLTLLVSVAIVYAYRVKVEERALVAVLGEPYRAYMGRTKRFIPFVV